MEELIDQARKIYNQHKNLFSRSVNDEGHKKIRSIIQTEFSVLHRLLENVEHMHRRTSADSNIDAKGEIQKSIKTLEDQCTILSANITNTIHTLVSEGSSISDGGSKTDLSEKQEA